LEKARSVSAISDESRESTSLLPLYKSCIDRQYEGLARQWGFDDKKTKEENIDDIQQKITAVEKRLDEQQFPRDEEMIELEGSKKLLKILPAIITPLMPTKITDTPKFNPQRKLSFEDPLSTMQHNFQNLPKIVSSTPSDHLEPLWQKATQRFGLSREDISGNNKLVKRIREINQSRLEYYQQNQDEPMIQAYQKELEWINLIEKNLLKIETKLLGEISPINKEQSEFQGKILPFENEQEYYRCAEPWGIKRNGSS